MQGGLQSYQRMGFQIQTTSYIYNREHTVPQTAAIITTVNIPDNQILFL
ncbi:MAG TPA: hypothetical protein VN704_09185 [Verrucomicrobiae bacterium]|nr:hypothetical protein [Verrucomicrobiae bacterium]